MADQQQDTCSICLEDINAKTGRVEMSCGHAHHFQCLTTWFKSDPVHQGPLCRKVATGLEDYKRDVAQEEEAVESEGGWVRLTFTALNTILLAQNGLGITPEVRSGLDHVGNEHTEICRAEFNRILLEQGGRRFDDAQWNLMQRAFPATQFIW